ncbi:signal peptidase II [Candidatus Woesearchaeota archaeon]|nr:signal peptidase II [Candidatus Woesearchaeota archaeon]
MKIDNDSKKFFIAAIIVIALDLFSKILVRNFIALGQEIRIFGIFSLTHTTNTGAGFSILQGYNAVLIWVAVMAMGALAYYINEFKGKSAVWIGMAFGGIAGNLVDRIAFGRVTDFLDFHYWPVFNIADSALVLGVIFYAWQTMREK